MPRQAIRHEGDKAEISFRRLVPDSRESQNAKLGDAEVLVDGHWHFVEVKECHSNTINQVRAIKFIPLIIFDGQTWYVVPPHEVVRLVSAKSRGQHTEIPFESANLSLRQLSVRFQCADSELAHRVAQAISDGQRFGEIKTAMNELLSELIALNKRIKANVAAIFRRTS